MRSRAQRLAWREAKIQKAIEERIKPVEEFVQEQRRAAVDQAMMQKSQQLATTLFSEAANWPHFTENKPLIGQKYRELVGQGMQPEPAFYRAYQIVLHDKIRNTSNQAGQARAQALLAKPSANTMNPSRPAPAGQRPKLRDGREAAAYIFGSRAS